MIFLGKYRILKNKISACDCEYLLDQIQKSIKKNRALLISPIASYTLVLAYFDKELRKMLDRFDYLAPDSQWVKRSLYFLYGLTLKKRVYGPDLMLKICNLAQEKKYNIFLYGNTTQTLKKLKKNLFKIYSDIKIVGQKESKFRALTKKEVKNLVNIITNSKTDIIFISLGSPVQEAFSVRLMNVSKSFVIVPVGAAFDFISGAKPQAPSFMQNIGLEWLFRFVHEPRRLWKRYIVDGILFVLLILRQKITYTFSGKE